MINYKKTLKINLKIIHNYNDYLLKYKLNNKNINRFNELFLLMKNLFNFKIKKVSNYQLYIFIKDLLIKNEYNLSFDKITNEIIEYQNTNYLTYKDIWEIKSIIYILCIEEIANMLDYETDNVVKYNSRKTKTLQYINNTLGNIINMSDLYISDKMSLTSIKLLKYKEYKDITDNDKKIVIKKIVKRARKMKLNEIDIVDEMIDNGKYFGDTFLSKNNYFPYILFSSILIFLLLLIINIYFKNIIILIISILFSVIIFKMFHFFRAKQFIPKYISDIKNEKLLCIYYKKISSPEKINDLFNEIEQLSKDNNYDYCIYGECTSCDHQIEPFDNEIMEVGLELCDKLNKKYQTNRFHFVYRKRNKDFNYNIWRGFDQFNGSIKDIYDLITNSLNTHEKENLFRCYTSNFNEYSYLMYFNNISEFNKLIDNFGILLHQYNEDYKSITYGDNFYNESFIYDSFIMRLEDIEYAKGTNGLIVKRSLAIDSKKYSIENIYKNNLRILMNKKNTTQIQFISVIKNVLSIVFDITLFVSIMLMLFNNINTIYFLIFSFIFINDIGYLPINLYYKIKVIICYLLSKKYRYDKLPLYSNNKYIFLYIINIILIAILTYINSFNILNVILLFVINIIYSIKVLIINRRYKND